MLPWLCARAAGGPGEPLREIIGARYFQWPAAEDNSLLRLARELYPRDPAECEVVLEFLRGQLCKLRVTSENECPASEMDLVEWIAAGQEFGQKVKPEKVQIFRESDRQSFEGAFGVTRQVLTEAGSADPIRLLSPLKRWQEGAYGWSEPKCYGEELARVVYFADFAIWMAL